ncbi:patatin-like phospholipase family protein [Chromobacterium sp. CV08]|uniref:patatin-like phospholipase family protein n=1 Tax=Chromobacterium sp. CV08 TaxID=3133274 RepID=UPI003DA91A40
MLPDTPYRILSIDGGGLRGIVALVVLDRLDRAAPGWRDGINMYAGTSTGALIAMGLARGLTPGQLLGRYREDGPSLFSRSLAWRLKTLNGLIGPRYDGKERERVCRQVLGETSTLASLLRDGGRRGHVLVPAFNLDGDPRLPDGQRRWKPKVYHNLPTRDGSDDGVETAWRVAMRSTAAPTYFPSFDGFVDGGVFANNPAMCALAQTRDARLRTPIPLESVAMLSLGTGVNAIRLAGDADWGDLQWGRDIVDLLMDGVNDVADFQARQLLGARRYLRVSALLDQPVPLDDVRQMARLEEIAGRIDLSEATGFVDGWRFASTALPVGAAVGLV